MRAYTIVLFILSLHAVLAMINLAHPYDIGLNLTLDTSSHGGIVTIPVNNSISIPSSTFFNESANVTAGDSVWKHNVLNSSSVVDRLIENIAGAAGTFGKLITTFKDVAFSIHWISAPYFGDFNAWVLEAMVDFIFAMSLFQMVSGRSFKTME